MYGELPAYPGYTQGNAQAMTATPTPQPYQILEENRLKRTTGHSDHTLEQAWRDETHAVYKHFGAFGQYIGWEAIKIRIAPPAHKFGKHYPARELYPSAEQFGKYALSVGAQYDLDYAIAKAKTL